MYIFIYFFIVDLEVHVVEIRFDVHETKIVVLSI